MKNTINLRMAFFGLPAYNVIDEPRRAAPDWYGQKGSSAAKYVSDGDSFGTQSDGTG